jgi:Flp pilus assembly protein TadG
VINRFAAHYRRRKWGVSGQSLVETALILPLLTLLLIGLVEFGMLLYAHVQVANAAREAARAASLYNSTRYGPWADGSTINTCEGSIDGWSLNLAVQQAIVNRGISTSGSSKGCPNTSGTIIYTSLGRLDSTATFNATVTPAQSTYYNATTNPKSSPTPGTAGTVTLVYSYQLPIVSNLIPYLSNPISIRKSVQYEYQQ